MTWIDDCLAKQSAAEDRALLIRQHSGPIYDALWQEIVRCVQEAKSKTKLRLITNGALFSRIVRKPLSVGIDESATSEEFILTMEGATVKASGDRVDIEFDLDVCPDGVVCLKRNGEPISVAEASRLILEPFLFPDLRG